MPRTRVVTWQRMQSGRAQLDHALDRSAVSTRPYRCAGSVWPHRTVRGTSRARARSPNALFAEYALRMARVGLVVDSDSPLLSVALLFEELQTAARGCGDLEVIAGSEVDDERAAAIVASKDVIVGMHAAILRQRQRLGRSVPILLPSYGLGTRAMLPLYEAGNLLAVGDGFICPSTADHAAAVRHLRGDGLRAHLLPYPVPRHVRGIEHVHQRQLPWSRSLVYVGRVTPQKNVHLLLSCVAALGARGLPVSLTIVGAEDGSSFPEACWNADGYSSYLRSLAERLGVVDRVRFVGAVAPSEVASHYLNADINMTLSTFRTEDFGFVQVEAAAAGLPTVATAWGGFWDTVAAGVSGIHVPVALTRRGPRVDWMAAVDIVERLASRPYLLERYKRSAAAWAAGFSPDIFAERFGELIAKVVEQRSSDLRLLDAEDCVSPEARAYFDDLARRKPTTKAEFFAARRGLFSDKPERFRQFFAAYIRDRVVNWDAESRPYRVCTDSLFEDRLEVECPLKSYSVPLSATQKRLLSGMDGERSVAQLATRLEVPLDTILVELAELTEAGVVLPRARVEVTE
jgi:glycosyltransferase involved in cell wall biosynthesis